MQTQAIIFDFFGVFVGDTFNMRSDDALTREQAQRLRAEVMSKVDRNEIDRTQFFTILSEVSGGEVEVIKDAWSGLQTLNTELVDTVRSLKDYKLGLCSNAASWELRPILERYELEPLFDAVAISGEVGVAKPDPALFTYICEELSITPEEALCIDDSAANVRAAESHGMSAILYTDTHSLQTTLRDRGLLSLEF